MQAQAQAKVMQAQALAVVASVTLPALVMTRLAVDLAALRR